MTGTCVKTPKTTGSGQGRYREDVDAAGKRREDEVWIKHVNWKRLTEWNAGAAQKLKTLRTTSLSEQRPGWLKHEIRSIKWACNEAWKKMMKEEMENNKVVMCHSCGVHGEETKEKHRNWYCIISIPYMPSVWPSYWRTSNCLAVYVVKRLQRNNEKQYLWCKAETRKWYHPNSIPYMLNESLSHWRTPKLSCSTCSGKSCKVENENSICSAELKQNSIHGAELKQNTIYMVQSWNRTISVVQNWYKEDKEQDDERWIFCFLSAKEEQYPTEK